MKDAEEKKKILLKDQLFNDQGVNRLADEIKSVWQPFKKDTFTEEVIQAFPSLELKERMYHIRDLLAVYLPDDYEQSLAILLKALPEALDPTQKDNDFGEFIYASYGEYVVKYGCSKALLSSSLHALREMTKCFSMEYAIRDFINTFPEETFAMLSSCASSDNYHERRFASEGLRPKLPWAKGLTVDPLKALKILDILYFDKTRYVTRSVANHMNDLSKSHPREVIACLKKWKTAQKQNEKEMEYIIKHALRTLLKRGNQEALALLGYVKSPKIIVKHFILRKQQVKIGERLGFDLEIEAEASSDLLIDYVIGYRTQRGSYNSKVYKLKKLSIEKNSSVILSKTHHFKAGMTTRKLHPGQHKLFLQINGDIYQECFFDLFE